MPASVGSPIAAANSVTENSATRGAPGPATGIPVSPWSHTVAASARESTECIAAQATAACSFRASAGIDQGPVLAHRGQHRGGGVEVGGGAPCHDLIPAPSTDTRGPENGVLHRGPGNFFEKFSTRRRARPGPVLTSPNQAAWSRQARPPRGGVVSTGSTTEVRRGLDRLDHRGLPAWSRQARPPRVAAWSRPGSTTDRAWLDRLDHPGCERGPASGGPWRRTRSGGNVKVA